MSEECVKLVPQLWSSAPVVQESSALSAVVSETGAKLLITQSRQNRAAYDALLDRLLSLMESGTL